jgi:hypothetical protein
MKCVKVAASGLMMSGAIAKGDNPQILSVGLKPTLAEGKNTFMADRSFNKKTNESENYWSFVTDFVFG